ncbi:GH25 family lysozyme [Fodinicola feengrottensis]|uniref:GH25 family lysozyme n=1 Tax=Fodinicola feengrottensis TaxID=435914 RepID=UPI0031D2BECC
MAASAAAALVVTLVTVTPASAATPRGPGHEGMEGPPPAVSNAVQPAVAGVPGIDVSHYQGTINWTSVKNAGIKWAYIKATESTTYKDPTFNANYTNAYNAGLIRGAYHFARPADSSGAAQATYFATHGGGWSADNHTLPGMLDLEGSCASVAWIRDFYNTYKAKTGRDVVIYTSASWWNSCTGGSSAFASLTPLDVASWGGSSPTMPRGFGAYTMWQYTDSGSVSGISGAVDRDTFNGSEARLLALANNTP